ncbi:MAG: hypothetical protein FVQ82_01520 [Planctomycetes bacterium]|nr:hypothetical protein [Planctomycetota bacterium]
MSKYCEKVDFNYCLICKNFYKDWTAPLSIPISYTVAVTLNVIRGAFLHSDPDQKDIIETFKAFYLPRSDRFLDPNKTLAEEHIKSSDLLVLTDCQESDQDHLEAMLEVMYLKGLIDRPEPDKEKAKDRYILALRALIRKIPVGGTAFDALLFGKE